MLAETYTATCGEQTETETAATMAAAAALLRLPLWRAAARGPGPRGARRRLPGAAPGATGRPGSPRRGLAAAAGDGEGAGQAGAAKAKAEAGGEPWWRGPEYREDFPGLLSELRGRLARRQAQSESDLPATPAGVRG